MENSKIFKRLVIVMLSLVLVAVCSTSVFATDDDLFLSVNSTGNTASNATSDNSTTNNTATNNTNTNNTTNSSLTANNTTTNNTVRNTATNNTTNNTSKTNNNVNSVKYRDRKFLVDIGIELQCDKLIVATGGMAAPKTGSTGLGYPLAEQFGHTIVETKPALTALITEKDLLNKAAGVRTTANIWFENSARKKDGNSNEANKYSETGELQITDYGISGIPVFNISRMATKGTLIHIDFIPDYSINDIVEYWAKTSDYNPKIQLGTVMDGILNTKITAVMLEKACIKYNCLLGELHLDETLNLLKLLKDYQIVVNKPRGFNFAQVTAGGVSTEEVNSLTMESKKQPGLYFAGEILDVDGICGGYNLQFAWATGATAGRNCVE